MSTAEYRKIGSQDLADDLQVEEEEVWDLSADEEPPPPPAKSIFDDFDFEDEGVPASTAPGTPLMEFPAEQLSGASWDAATPDGPMPAAQPNIPGLRSGSAPVAKYVEQLGQSWENQVDEDVPELPGLDDLQFQDAAPAAPEAPSRPEPQTGGRARPSSSSELRATPPPAAPAPKQKSVDDLLGDLLQDDMTGEDVAMLYFIRRQNKKDFGPFTEDKILELLHNRKLMGEELSRLQHETQWVPLRERPDFRPTIELLSKQHVSLGWGTDEPRPKEPPAPAPAPPLEEPIPEAPELPAEDTPTMTLPGKRGDAFDIADIILDEKQDQAPPPATGGASQGGGVTKWLTDVRVLIGVMAVLIVSIIFVIIGDKSATNGPGGKRRTITRKFSLRRLAIEDLFSQHKILLENLLENHRANKKQLSWYRLRFVYYLLDSYGQDRTIRTDVAPIYKALERRAVANKSAPVMWNRIKLAKAISERDQVGIKDALASQKKPLTATHPEWGYMLGRGNELLGEDDAAFEAYLKLVAKHPRHVRALLGLHRLYLKRQNEKQAADYLWKAFRRVKRHLPAQLMAFDFATRTSRWESYRTGLQKRIKQLVRQRQYTQASLAKWYAIVAQQMWQERKTEKAVYRIEQAVTLNPEHMGYFLRKIRYYGWSRQYFQALRAVQKQVKKHPHNRELLMWEIRLLHKVGYKNKIPSRLTTLQDQLKSEEQKYLLYYLLGFYYEREKRFDEAIESYQKAISFFPKRKKNAFATLALARVRMKDKDWGKVRALLAPLTQVKNPELSVLVAWGNFLLATNQDAKALVVAKKLQNLAHTRFEGYLLEAKAHRQRDQLEKAIPQMRRALYLHPQRPSELLLQLSDLYNQKKAYEKSLRSLQQYEKLLQGDPSCGFLRRKGEVLRKTNRCRQLLQQKVKGCRDLSLYIVRGECAEKLGQRDKALRIFRRARFHHPEQLEPLLALAAYYEKHGMRGKASRFRRILQRKKPEARKNLLDEVSALERKKHYTKAYEQLRLRRHVFPKDFEVSLVFARITGMIGRTRTSINLLLNMRRGATGKLQQALIYSALGDMYRRVGKLDKATESFETALKARSRTASAHLGLGLIYNARKEYDKCISSTLRATRYARGQRQLRDQARDLLKQCKEAKKAN